MLFRIAFAAALVLAIPTGRGVACFAADGPPSPIASGKVRVYFGTYTVGDSKGIYVTQLDVADGRLAPAELAGAVANPSFLAIHPTRRFLYAVGELGDFQGKKGGAVSGFSIDPKTGKLALLNQQSSQGPGPCHLTLDRQGKWALVANYSGGSVACLPVAADGRLGQASSFVQHQGSGADPKRQSGPHAHSVNLDAANRFAFVADLGLDKVLIYQFDRTRGTLEPNQPAWVSVAPGSGPRHFAFHPNGRNAYVINEMASTVTAMSYDAVQGSLSPIQTISTLPEGYHGASSTAEVQVHPSGKFVYGSNRGHDSIAIFAVDDAGKLRQVGVEPSGGRTPRNFGIDPTGQYLLAAHQDTGNVVVFRIDARNGKLKATAATITVPSVVCVKMVPLAE